MGKPKSHFIISKEIYTLEAELEALVKLNDRFFIKSEKQFCVEFLENFEFSNYSYDAAKSLNEKFKEWYKLAQIKELSSSDLSLYFSKQIQKIKSAVKQLLSKSYLSFDVRTLIRSFIRKSFVNRVQEDEFLIISHNNIINYKRNNQYKHVYRSDKTTIYPNFGFAFR